MKRRAFIGLALVSRWAASALAASGPVPSAAAENPAGDPSRLPALVVTATRAPQSVAILPVTVDVVNSVQLRDSPALTLDDTLRDSAAFSLFRRSGSLVANPTAQGVSLRGLGPSGASRSLVLLDGIPLNDPFGGWVAWSKIPRATLDRVEIVRGGGAASWGNAALGGTIQLLSGAPANRATFAGGAFDTWQAEFSAAHAAGPGTLWAGAREFRTDGFFTLAPADRGPVDRPLDSRHRLVHAGWKQSLGTTLNAGINGRIFTEDRGNGTVLQQNRSREEFLSAFVEGQPSAEHTWRAVAYAQRQRFAAFFSGVSANRATETPANDQYHVPSTAAGAGVQSTWVHPDRAVTTVGADARWVEGETRENFFLTAGSFTRRRVAGGAQRFAGAFATHTRPLAAAWQATASARLDAWNNTGGHRHETILATGARVRDDTYADQQGTEFSPQLGIVWQPADRVRWRANAYRAFRLPTLNEYYRPFRVGIANTEANPSLRRETVAGFETGLEFSGRNTRLVATVFDHELSHAVANVTLTRTPSLISRQRQNLDRIRVRGLELTGEWNPSPGFRVRADWLVNDARVRRASAAAATPAGLPSPLDGRWLPQVPRHTATLQVDWRPDDDLRLSLRGRYSSRQFEDDENTLPLAAAATLDARINRRLGPNWETYLAVENLAGARIETGRSSEGVATLGPPRTWRAGAEFSW